MMFTYDSLYSQKGELKGEHTDNNIAALLRAKIIILGYSADKETIS